MPYRLLRFALARHYPEPRMFRAPGELKTSYDAVIIGGGGHGLATAYYLAHDFGMTDVAVLEKDYIGGGGTGRNTAIVRSNYLTPEGVRFYDASLTLFQGLSAELDLNLFYSERGHFTLAHSDASLRTMRWRAEVNKHLGVDSEVVDRDFIQQTCPQMDLDCGGHGQPVLGALYHPPGGILRHDAVAWGYARAADRLGVEIHQQLATEKKLFCRCPTRRFSKHHDAEVLRHMRPTLSEMGGYDGCALMEFKTKKDIVYLLNKESVCTYEMDDTPPFPINQKALDIAIEIALMLDCSVVDEMHIARKQYLDGSIPTGFQRTGIVGVNGTLPFGKRSIHPGASARNSSTSSKVGFPKRRVVSS